MYSRSEEVIDGDLTSGFVQVFLGGFAICEIHAPA
jgi:hypothetical protein